MADLPPMSGATDHHTPHAEKTSDDSAFEAARRESIAELTKLERQPYAYATNSPIEHLSATKAQGAVDKFSDNVWSFYKPHQDGTQDAVDAGIRDSNNNPVGTQQWQNRTLDSMRSSQRTYSPAGDPAYVYNFAGVPVGIVKMRHSPRESRIETMATHPGTSQGGGTLVAFAVNESQKNNHSGVIRLYTTDASKVFYEKLGFKQDGESSTSLVLDPSTRPDIWTKDESMQRWTLNKHAGRGYLSPNPLYKGKG